MKISPITNVNYGIRTNQNRVWKKYCTEPVADDTVCFQGKVRVGGAIGGVVGTLAGVGLGCLATLATGGLAAPLFLGMAGCTAGAIGGDVIDHTIRPGCDDED